MTKAWHVTLILFIIGIGLVGASIIYDVISTTFSTACYEEWDAPRAKFYVWCERNIVGSGSTREEALKEYEKFKLRPPSYKVPLQ